MAAVIQAQLRKFEGILKPHLYEGPLNSYWSLLEQKVKVRREQVALGLLGVLALYLAFGWGNDFLCNFIGFLYPAYASILAVESKGASDEPEWIVYWVLYASFGVVEYIGHNFFHTLPLYWLGKCLFLIWLWMPGQKGGSQVLYQRLLRPLAAKFQPTVDQSIEKIYAHPSDYVTRNTN